MSRCSGGMCMRCLLMNSQQCRHTFEAATSSQHLTRHQLYQCKPYASLLNFGALILVLETECLVLSSLQQPKWQSKC
jgi:hypothetical protein